MKTKNIWTPLLILFFLFLALTHPILTSPITPTKDATNKSLPDLLIERITIPVLPQVQEQIPVIVTIRNEGDADYVYSSSNRIYLLISENGTRKTLTNKKIPSIRKGESKVIYIPINLNLSKELKNISLSIKIDSEDKSKENNNTTVNISLHQKLEDGYGEERRTAILKAFRYLEQPSEALNPIYYCYIATVAPTNPSFYNRMEMKIISDVKQYANGIINSTEVRDWAVASIAISSLGENPKNFSNINFISTLYSFFDGTQFGYKWRLDDDIFAIIALSAAGEKGKVINRSVKNLIALQNEDGGWGYGVDDESSVTFTALAIQAILASGVVKPNNESIRRAISFLKENQLPDGGFPYDERSENVSRAYPTALVISA
ncbi:MAG: CARDB domain-containing protein, partial [Candidatus Methanospirareceae archaeon]